MAKVKIKTTVATKPMGCNPQAHQEFVESAGHSQSKHGRVRKPVSRPTAETAADGKKHKEVTNFVAEVKECDEANAPLHAFMLMQLTMHYCVHLC